MRNSTERIFLPSPHGELAGVIHFPEHLPASVVVCCHGLLSVKESSKYVMIGEEFSRQGMAVFRFDFSGCGESPNSPEKKLISVRLDNLRDVLDYVSKQEWCNGMVGLLGSSLGGYLSLIVAGEADKGGRAVVCWATPFDLSRIERALVGSKDFRDQFPEGTELGSPMSLESMLPVERVLVIHGKQDETVPWQHAVQIYRKAGEPKRLYLMETADHRFLDPDCRELARRLSFEWFREQGL